MKLGTGVIGIIIAGILGYLLEPSIRPALLPSKKVIAESGSDSGGSKAPQTPDQIPAVKAPVEPPAIQIPDWVLKLAPEQLPEKVTLKSKALVPVEGASEPMTLPAGMQVTPVRIDGSFLVFTSLAGPSEGKTPIVSTDLVTQLVSTPPPAPPVASNDPMPAQPPAGGTPPAPEPAAPEPEPEPEPEPAKRLSDEEIVAVMQESVKAGQIKEFTFDQVLGWKATEDKESDGDTFQSGLASYKAETIFGVKNIQAQALIKEGKVVKWIWPKSGMEIN
ncbi:MAG: hypothetical protein AAGI48_14865 [Verrucomicrobiota bacterium]